MPSFLLRVTRLYAHENKHASSTSANLRAIELVIIILGVLKNLFCIFSFYGHFYIWDVNDLNFI